MFGKIETSKINRINRERKNTIIFALAVEVTANITHINPQQTKMTKKRMTCTSGRFEKGKKKMQPIFQKMRPYKQRQEQRFETIEI